MKWVTWENIGVDRMASAWLIRRWVDPKAEFTFIPIGGKLLARMANRLISRALVTLITAGIAHFIHC